VGSKGKKIKDLIGQAQTSLEEAKEGGKTKGRKNRNTKRNERERIYLRVLQCGGR